jgi:hypothetical protein
LKPLERTGRLSDRCPLDLPRFVQTQPDIRAAADPGNDIPHPDGGVHLGRSAAFEQGAGGEWQYWSRPCSDWGKSKKTVTAYMSFILWETQ